MTYPPCHILTSIHTPRSHSGLIKNLIMTYKWSGAYIISQVAIKKHVVLKWDHYLFQVKASVRIILAAVKENLPNLSDLITHNLFFTHLSLIAIFQEKRKLHVDIWGPRIIKVLLSLTYGFRGHLSIDIQLAVGEQERKEHFLNRFYMA